MAPKQINHVQETDGVEVFKVKLIADQRTQQVDGREVTEYLVVWDNYDTTEATWQEAEDISDDSLEEWETHEADLQDLDLEEAAMGGEVSDDGDGLSDGDSDAADEIARDIAVLAGPRLRRRDDDHQDASYAGDDGMESEDDEVRLAQEQEPEASPSSAPSSSSGLSSVPSSLQTGDDSDRSS